MVALGLGPGDPELLTIRAVHMLGKADRVFVPGDRAKSIVARYCDSVTVLSFPMTEEEEEIARCMELNAEIIAPVARNGLAVFGILGDPNFFGTYSRLRSVLKRKYPDIVCTSIPGISSITAFASAAGITISDGFAVTDGSDLTSLLLLKVREPQRAMRELQERGYSEFVLVERMFMDEEKIYRNSDIPERSPYFSVLFARR